MNEPLTAPLAKPLTETPAEVKQKDWEIGELYKNSWRIIKKHKVLWLFGMAVSASSASYSSNSSRSSSGSNSNDFDWMQRFFPTDGQASQQDLSMVLGTATDAIGDKIAAIFANIPPYFYLLFALELVFLFGTAIVIGIIYRGWAEAALVEGIQTAMTNGNVTIRVHSEKAFKNIKAIIFLRYVPFLALIGIFILLVIITALMGPIAPLFALVAIISLAYGLIIITFTQIWAVRKVVLEHLPAKQAFKEGYNIARSKFWAMLLLGIINTLLAMLLGGIIMAPALITLISGFFSFETNPTIGTILISFGLLLAIVFGIAFNIVGGIVTSFKDTVWSHAYVAIKGKYDK